MALVATEAFPEGSESARSQNSQAEIQRQLRRRVDAAVKTMMEGYIAAVEAAKASSESDRAVNHYVQCCYTAAMARAAEDLLRLAGELSVARAASGGTERVQALGQEQKELEKKVKRSNPRRWDTGPDNSEGSRKNSDKAERDGHGPALSLVHRHVFGLKPDVKNNETQIIYPAGTNAVLWQADQKQQKIFQGHEDGQGLTCMAVNSTKRYLAVAEKCYEGAICTIFDLVTAKKRKTLSWPESDAPEFLCVAFSADSKYLITQTGRSPSAKHDWSLLYWVWDKQRVMASIKVSNPQNSLIRECSFNPTDSSIVCVIGDGILKFMQLKDGFKTLPVAPAKLQSFMCHTWLHDDKMLVGADNGDLLLFDNAGEFQTVLPTSPGEPRAATCVIPFSKGFIIGGDDGRIRIYEKSDEPKEIYRQSKVLQVEPNSGAAVRSLALSPSEELLGVSTSTAQLYQLSLLGQDLMKAEESPAFEPVLSHFHTGAILGLDVCIRKPLVVTCGIDKSARVWNYFEKTCVMCRWFNEEAYSIAFHPSGFHLIIGQSDKLRLMNLLMEDMKTYKDIAIKQCRECRFSNGGQYFAAVNTNATNAIQVYKTYTCEPIETLRGHTNKVRSVAWTADDSMLVSTGADGAVYEYYVQAETANPGRDGRRVHDFVQKTSSFSCVIVHSDQSSNFNTMYVVGNDQLLRKVYKGLHYQDIWILSIFQRFFMILYVSM
eukprot:s1205_g17.t1